MRRTVCAALVVAAILGTGIPSASATYQLRVLNVGIYPATDEGGNVVGCYLGGIDRVWLGRVVQWTNHDQVARTVTQRDRFWEFGLDAGSSIQLTMHSAGNFHENCDHGWNDWGIKVAVRVPLHPDSRSFTVRWAGTASPSDWTYDVRYRIGSYGNWTTWTIWQTATSERWATFTGAHGKTYQFQGRTIGPGGTSGWGWKRNTSVP
jgi:hypothetical protein